MKITEVRVFPVWVGIRNQLLVKVETDEGIHGWGESGLSGRERAVAGAIEHFAGLLRGRDARQTGALWQEVYRSQYFEGGRVLTAALSAIDIALHDIKGKALGVPVYELLGGRQRDVIPTFATTTRAPPGPEMTEQAQALMEHGWNCMRLSPSGHESTGEAYEPREHLPITARGCIQAREALGDAVVLGIDYQHRLDGCGYRPAARGARHIDCPTRRRLSVCRNSTCDLQPVRCRCVFRGGHPWPRVPVRKGYLAQGF